MSENNNTTCFKEFENKNPTNHNNGNYAIYVLPAYKVSNQAQTICGILPILCYRQFFKKLVLALKNEIKMNKMALELYLYMGSSQPII